MKTFLCLCLMLISFGELQAHAQIGFEPPNMTMPRPQAQALGLQPYNAQWSNLAPIYFIVDQTSNPLSTCISSNYSACFPGSIRFRTGDILATTLTLSSTLKLSALASTANPLCMPSGTITNVGCTSVSTVNAINGAVTITGGSGISVTTTSPNISVAITGGFTGTKTVSGCVFSINNGLITNVTGTC